MVGSSSVRLLLPLPLLLSVYNSSPWHRSPLTILCPAVVLLPLVEDAEVLFLQLASVAEALLPTSLIVDAVGGAVSVLAVAVGPLHLRYHLEMGLLDLYTYFASDPVYDTGVQCKLTPILETGILERALSQELGPPLRREAGKQPRD